ncbi:MAG TPA: ComEA family DNA-binding protein [Patescibacteria group bacterium]
MDTTLIWEKLKPHWLPLTLGLLGMIFLVCGLIVFSSSKKDKPDILFEAASDVRAGSLGSAQTKQLQTLAVDIEGAVMHPGVYKLPSDARVQDVLIAAGGMSSQADRGKIAKTLNLAAKVTDGGKIYIPVVGETNTDLAAAESNVQGEGTSSTLNINSASLKDLDTLLGIGEVTAQKIISNRPYTAVDEMLAKKVVSQKVFNGIKDKISVY